MTTTTEAPATPRASRPAPAPEPRRERMRRSWERHWYAWAMVAPVVTVLGGLVMYPLARGVWLSFTDLNERNQVTEICQRGLLGGETCRPNPDRWEYVGLDNYVDVLTGSVGSFWQWAWVTVIWTTVCVFFHYSLGLGLAMLLNRKVRGRGVYRVMLIVPWAVPAFISAFAWRFLYDENFGLFNAMLEGLGFDRVSWYAHQSSALFAAITVNIWLGVPFMMVAVLGGLQSIPGELYEAAEMDGASPWRRFVDVTLPGLRPVSMTVVLLGTIWTFNMFPIIFLVTGGAPAGKTEILVTGAYRAAFEGIRDYSLASTYGVLILSMLLVFAVGYRRVLRSQGEVW